MIGQAIGSQERPWSIGRLIDRSIKKGSQKRPQSIGQAKAKKAGEAAVD